MTGFNDIIPCPLIFSYFLLQFVPLCAFFFLISRELANNSVLFEVPLKNDHEKKPAIKSHTFLYTIGGGGGQTK